MSDFIRRIEVACPKCKKRSKHMPIDTFWGCEFCDYSGHRTTFLDWSESTDHAAPPEPVPEPVPKLDCQSSSMATCQKCKYYAPPDSKYRYFGLASVMSCTKHKRNYIDDLACNGIKRKEKSAGSEVKTCSEYFERLEDERRLAAKKLALSELKERFEQDRMKLTWLEEANYRMSQPPGSMIYRDSKPKGDSPMKIKRFIVRSFLRTFRNSLFILAIWKAAELVHWAWPGLKMAGRMLYPPIYAVAHAVDIFVENSGTATPGYIVAIIWILLICVAAVAIALLYAAWRGLNCLARAAFAAEQA